MKFGALTNCNLKYLFVFVFFAVCFSCSEDTSSEVGYPDNVMDYLTEVPSTFQRSGDATIGKDYLLYGDFIKSGIPRSIYNITGQGGSNELNRSGDNVDIPFDYTSVKTEGSIEVVAPNCFQCHAGYANGQFILGVGNTSFDFTTDQTSTLDLLDNLVTNNFGNPSPTWDAYFPFTRAVRATGSHLITETVGSNSADKLALVLAAHRNKDDLTWIDVPQYDIPSETIPADVPAWWLLKKKTAMFSTAIGRGDYAKMMMASSVLTMSDSMEAREIDTEFVNVSAFIQSLEAPEYSGEINTDLSEKGRLVFLENCAVCHGTYGTNGTYTTYIVNHELIETDRNLAESNYAYGEFADWFNNSWFSRNPGAFITPGNGYVAQPLDGVWATAPYLHNGSVPTIEDLLLSEQRPKYWRRSKNTTNYDHQKIGWQYSVEENKKDRFTYDTTLPGYGNEGHTFGDHLSIQDRSSLLEYLKTL